LLNRLNFANAAARRAPMSSPAQTGDQLTATLVDGNITSNTRDGLQAFAASHPDDHAGLLYMTMATPEFQLN